MPRKSGRAVMAIRQIHTCHLPIPLETIEPIHEKLLLLEETLQARLLPVSVCAYCKGLHGHVEACEECSATGLTNTEGLNSAPARLRDTLRVQVFTHGVYHTVSDENLCGSDHDPKQKAEDVW